VQKPITVLIALILFSPFLILLAHFPIRDLHFGAEVPGVFLFTFLQAAASAVVSLGIGLCGAMGLLAAQNRLKPFVYRAFEGVVILPAVVPSLFLIFAVLEFLPQMNGALRIVITHALLNSGLAAVVIARLLLQKIGGMAELASVEGSSRWKFYRVGVWPLIKRDLLFMGLFVFTFSFTSFAIPLVLGGSRATTVEVLIYERLRIYSDWSQALALAILQMLFIFILSWFLRKSEVPKVESRHINSRLLGWMPGLFLIFVSPLILFTGLFGEVVIAWVRLRGNGEILADLPNWIGGSALIAFATGFICAFLLLLLAYLIPRRWFRRMLSGYAAPSAVLTGFALLLIWPSGGACSYVKIIFGLSLISLPALYRLSFANLLSSLDSQIVMAQTLGASAGQIFSQVTCPQVIRQAFWLAGLASFWAWGDFALSGIVAEKPLTLAMTVKALMDSYRLDMANGFLWLILLGGTLSWLFFVGVGRVLSQKSAR
jgi:thiamine transport system permease protein